MKKFFAQVILLLFLTLMSCSNVPTVRSHYYNEAYYLDHDPLYYKSTDSVLDPEIFVPCDKEPYVNTNKLSKLLIYPLDAYEQNLNGKVKIRILIDIDGSLKKYFIEESSNDVFNEFVINAIKEYGKFVPAINKGKPVICWITCPVAFTLH